MRILIDIGHPAHVHYFRNFIRILENKGHKIAITTRDKEITLYLLDKYDFKYTCTGKNLPTKLGKAYSIVRNDLAIYKVAQTFKPDIIVSFFSPFAAHVGKAIKKPVIGFSDTEHAKINIILSKLFTDAIVVPSCYWGSISANKEVRFNGYFELAYLHPSRFTPDPSIQNLLGVQVDQKYAILRFVSWSAAHDAGHHGLELAAKRKIVCELSKYVKVFISSEGEIPDDLKSYRIKIPPEKMHAALAYASLYIGEGATMASECAMLGTPAIYVNSLVVGYCTEQEEKYGLIYGFRNSHGVLEKAMELINLPGLKEEWQKRRQKMLSEKNDVTAFMVWFIENYPKSFSIMKENPDFQHNFK